MPSLKALGEFHGRFAWLLLLLHGVSAWRPSCRFKQKLKFSLFKKEIYLLCFLVVYFLQILAGIYPVSQLQEPYSSVGYLCERVPFLSVLKLKHPSLLEDEPQQGDQKSEELSWTAWDVCECKSVLSKSNSILFVKCKILNLVAEYVGTNLIIIFSVVLCGIFFFSNRQKCPLVIGLNSLLPLVSCFSCDLQ